MFIPATDEASGHQQTPGAPRHPFSKGITYLTARYIVILIIKMTPEIVVQAKAWNTPCLAFHSVIAERWRARRFAPLLALRPFMVIPIINETGNHPKRSQASSGKFPFYANASGSGW
jgi:hypothetical protein